MKDVLICSVRVYKTEKKSLETSMRETLRANNLFRNFPNKSTFEFIRKLTVTEKKGERVI